MAGATGWQGMLTPRYLIPPLCFRGLCCSALNLFFAIWIFEIVIVFFLYIQTKMLERRNFEKIRQRLTVEDDVDYDVFCLLIVTHNAGVMSTVIRQN